METTNKYERRIKKNNWSISVVVPMYNEEDNAESVLENLNSELKINFRDYEILVVESGSTDMTRMIVDKMCKKNNKIHLLTQEKKEGLGSAIRYGFSKSAKEIILYMDGDNPFDLNIIPKAFQTIKQSDAVVGYRIGKRYSFSRVIFSLVYNNLIKAIFGLTVNDINFSFKMIRKKCLKKIILKSNGFFIDAEILAELKRNNFIIKQIGINYNMRKNGKSSVSIGPKLIINMLSEMIFYIKSYPVLSKEK